MSESNKENSNSIAGMSLGGGRKENFFFCMLEYFEENKRWFLTTLKQVKDEQELNRDEAIRSWIKDHGLKKLMVDFPLTQPPCDYCTLDCPGTNKCHHPVVTGVRSQIEELLEVDKKLESENPKRYEQQRNEDDEIDFSKSVLEKETHHHILSKSFKRRLKKGFTPYWNRPLDFWIWKNYYDQILKSFNISFDSYGSVSLMLVNRFKYLRKHFPNDLSLYESDTSVILLELYRAKIISRKHLVELHDINIAPLARIQVAKEVEKKLDIFIYAKDLELIAKNPKAFDSFLLAVAGKRMIAGSVRPVPDFGEINPPEFIVPVF
jgi:hypothetical protein